MEKKPIYNVGETVYYINDNRIKAGEVTAVITKYSSMSKYNWFEYYVDQKEISDADIFRSKSDLIKRVLKQLHLDSAKVDFICMTLFPEEYQEDNNELTDDDFEQLETKEEPLQIEEKTSFWKGLFK